MLCANQDEVSWRGGIKRILPVFAGNCTVIESFSSRRTNLRAAFVTIAENARKLVSSIIERLGANSSVVAFRVAGNFTHLKYNFTCTRNRWNFLKLEHIVQLTILVGECRLSGNLWSRLSRTLYIYTKVRLRNRLNLKIKRVTLFYNLITILQSRTVFLFRNLVCYAESDTLF